MKRIKYNLLEKRVSFLLASIMVFVVLFGVVVNEIKTKAETINLSNPHISDDGTVIWDKIKFGSYYQDIKGFDEKPIKWRILSISDDGTDAILISDSVLDSKPFNETYREFAWETSSIREWLNSDFYNTAFTEEEQLEIKDTTIISDKEDGDSIIDKVYLLSKDDVSNTSYGFDTTFDNNTISRTRVAKATDYACENGADRASSYDKAGHAKWLLRSSGVYRDSASGVYYDGESYSTDFYENSGIRPVIHVNLLSSFIKNAGEIDSNGIETSSNDGYNNPKIINGVAVWDCVYFGNYKQDAVWEKNPIEWRVLSVEGDDALLIADKVLDEKPYHETNDKTYKNISWGNSTLREWLNGYFYNLAFTDAEKSLIKSTTVINDHQLDEANEATNTTDNIYLLSVSEASNSKYGFEESITDNSEMRKAQSTDFAYLNGARRENCTWWLRTAGGYATPASIVDENGRMDLYSSLGAIGVLDEGVRPVMHVDLSIDVTEADAVIEVDKLISSIGKVTKDSKASIESARKAYNELSDRAKIKVKGLGILEAAESNLAEIEKNSNNIIDNNTGNDTNTNSNNILVQNEQTSINDQQIALIDTVKIKSVSNIKKKMILIRWEKIKNVKGYEVQYAVNKKFTKKVKNKTTSKLKSTVKKLKKGKTYYVRVRAYNSGSNGNRVYGKWSAVKKVKIKK